MSVIAETYAEMEAARKLVEQIQEECSHPEAGVKTHQNHNRVDRVWEDNEDGYVGEFVNHYVPMVRKSCGLCGHVWDEEVDSENDN